MRTGKTSGLGCQALGGGLRLPFERRLQINGSLINSRSILHANACACVARSLCTHGRRKMIEKTSAVGSLLLCRPVCLFVCLFACHLAQNPAGPTVTVSAHKHSFTNTEACFPLVLLGVGCVTRGGVFQSWSLWAGVVRFVYANS